MKQSHIITKLLPHQKPLLRGCLRAMPRCALFADVGTGKSLVALAVADRIGARRILVTADKTNSLVTWPEQIARHTDYEICLWRSGRLAQVTIAGHDYLKWHALESEAPLFDFWIGDESTDYKNPRTWRVRALRELLRNIPRRIILSGLPVSERIEDIFGQALCLDGGKALGSSISRFRRRYMLPDIDGYGWVPKVDAPERIATALSPYLVTLPPATHVQMPEVEYKTIYVDLSPSQRAIYSDLRDKWRATVEGHKVEFQSAVARFSKLYQVCGGTLKTEEGDYFNTVFSPNPKQDAIAPIIQGAKGKIVIWARHVAELKMLYRWLSAWCPGPSATFLFDGRLNQKARRQTLHNFAKRRGKAVLLISLGFAKGLNDLIGCQTVIFYSNPFSFLTRAQAEGRTCRLGAKGRVTYYTLVARDTVDEDVWRMLQLKKDFVCSIDNFRRML